VPKMCVFSTLLALIFTSAPLAAKQASTAAGSVGYLDYQYISDSTTGWKNPHDIFCSGSLATNRSKTQLYFITAHHCILGNSINERFVKLGLDDDLLFPNRPKKKLSIELRYTELRIPTPLFIPENLPTMEKRAPILSTSPKAMKA
jgi:hypothetical protein